MQRKSRKWVLSLLVLLAAVYVGYRQQQDVSTDPASAPPPATGATRDLGAGEDALRAAYDEGRSDVWVEVAGSVQRVLADDLKGSRHQRWILKLAWGGTVLVAHNIDLAPRVPLAVGDRVRLRGEYEWNDRGGVVHWTHHDPQGRHEGGWIEHDGEQYR